MPVTILALLVPIILSVGCSVQSQRTAQATPPPAFVPATAPAVKLGNKPQEIATGDFNGDGKLDFVTSSEARTLSVFLGDGRGSFTPAPDSPLALEMSAHLIVVGDVNRDQKQDLVITAHDSFNVGILLGQGDGRFMKASLSTVAAVQDGQHKPHNHGLALGDLNADGNLDIVTSNYESNSVSVLLGNGKGVFTPATGSPFTVSRGPYNLSVADMNMDGKPDIVTPNVRDDSVTVLLGDGKGSFTLASNMPYKVETRPFYTAVGDFNGDRKPDLITTHDDITKLTISLGDGRGGLMNASGSPIDMNRGGYKVLVADMNRDAKPDVVVSNVGGNHVTVLLGDGTGRFTPAAGSPYTNGRGSAAIAIGDVNGDGKQDILLANSESQDVTIMLGG